MLLPAIATPVTIWVSSATGDVGLFRQYDPDQQIF